MRTAVWLTTAAALAAGIAASAAALAPGGTQEDIIKGAEAAAPTAIASEATVMDWDNNVLRQGSNGWTCFPDRPETPGPDPMCFDATAMAWAGAWMQGETPALAGVGLSYMLVGGADASNTDPFATEPPEGEDWVHAGPHVMIFVPDPADLDVISDDPNSGGPWVMFKGTPYAHIMMPVH